MNAPIVNLETVAIHIEAHSRLDVGRDYLPDFIYVSDRISPAITSGPDYDDLKQRMLSLAQSTVKSFPGTEYEMEKTDEWLGFRIFKTK